MNDQSETVPPGQRPQPLKSLPPQVFISYSHGDRSFVERLANDLAHMGILVWWDEWEIGVGDSILNKIQEGIKSSSYLVIVLSPNSVTSSWVREELNAALIRQLSDRRIIVKPILLKDCEIPLFLRDKKYADFRGSYDSGLAVLSRALKPMPIDDHGRDDEADYCHDYAFDWDMRRSPHYLRVLITSHSRSPSQQYSVSCSVSITANEALSARFAQYLRAGYAWAAMLMLLSLAEDLTAEIDAVIFIEGDDEATRQIELRDPKLGMGIRADVAARRLGPDPGTDLLYEWVSVFRRIVQRHQDGIRSVLHPSEVARFQAWLRENPPAEASGLASDI